MKKSLIPLLFAGFVVGCGGDVPTGTDGPAPNFNKAGNSGCHTVNINAHSSGVFPDFTGTTTGDVEADVSVAFDVGSVALHGVVTAIEGEETWKVTGGNIPEIINREISFRQRSVTIASPDNEPFVMRINGQLRAVDGVSKANLTIHGTFDARVFPFEVDLVLRGVVCP
jgi:hypothetical protein